ncbi:hypothetical protein B0T22DRAFT_125037 [Podospora appendiculata]|uniref:Uncharacterized protein n=1 Tax=Podospora appendiculata TaxID=314037 RepID=A0AAE1CBA4_9PEZI|nr:hypothetical protein B0T22DRAFT_125037 [Podospora appendiculata]
MPRNRTDQPSQDHSRVFITGTMFLFLLRACLGRYLVRGSGGDLARARAWSQKKRIDSGAGLNVATSCTHKFSVVPSCLFFPFFKCFLVSIIRVVCFITHIAEITIFLFFCRSDILSSWCVPGASFAAVRSFGDCFFPCVCLLSATIPPPESHPNHHLCCRLDPQREHHRNGRRHPQHSHHHHHHHHPIPLRHIQRGRPGPRPPSQHRQDHPRAPRRSRSRIPLDNPPTGAVHAPRLPRLGLGQAHPAGASHAGAQTGPVALLCESRHLCPCAPNIPAQGRHHHWHHRRIRARAPRWCQRSSLPMGRRHPASHPRPRQSHAARGLGPQLRARVGVRAARWAREGGVRPVQHRRRAVPGARAGRLLGDDRGRGGALAQSAHVYRRRGRADGPASVGGGEDSSAGCEAEGGAEGI